MSKIVVKGNFGNLRSRVIKKDQGFTKFLTKIAFLLNSRIQRRVQGRGQGIKGRMPSYSRSYKVTRRKKGRQTSKRDLTFTGNMWQSLSVTSKTFNKQAIMFFSGAEDNRKAFFNDERTPFFGLNTDEKSFLNSKLKDFSKL
jgi:hypothetical protein